MMYRTVLNYDRKLAVATIRVSPGGSITQQHILHSVHIQFIHDLHWSNLHWCCGLLRLTFDLISVLGSIISVHKHKLYRQWIYINSYFASSALQKPTRWFCIMLLVSLNWNCMKSETYCVFGNLKDSWFIFRLEFKIYFKFSLIFTTLIWKRYGYSYSTLWTALRTSLSGLTLLLGDRTEWRNKLM